MSKRNRREHGRIISVETKTRGDALADDVAAGVTSITVEDAGDFDEDGGWLLIGAQTVEFTECDDDTGVITLVDPLDAAAEQGDPVQVWSELYEEVVDYQLALVELDGEYDNPDPVVAEVAEGVGDLPEGDRGKAGESCTLKRVDDDEWEVVAVGGRGRQSQGTRWEQDDAYALTAADITAGSATMSLSHRPNDEALTCVLAGVPQRPTNWAINYDAQTLTQTLSGWEQADMVLWVHYAYRKGVKTESNILVDFEAQGWKYRQVAAGDSTDRSGVGFDDSGWAVGQAPFGYTPAWTGSVPAANTTWDILTRLWVRRTIPVASGQPVTINVRVEAYADVYWNGALVGTVGDPAGNTVRTGSISIAAGQVTGNDVLAIRASDNSVPAPDGRCYFDAQVVKG